MSLTMPGKRKERIREALTILTVRVKLDNSRGRTDINADAEDFYCGLLNIILDLELKNQNLLQMDFPAIDLADEGNRVCIQVTSTEGRSKITGTLEKFFSHGLHSKFDRLLVLIIGDKPGYQRPFALQDGFSFDPEQDIWDRAKLLKEIEQLSEDKLAQVDDYLCTQLEIDRREQRRLLLPVRSALAEGAFVGREEELKQIEQRFQREQVVVLSGLGGMGKTVLAARYGRLLEERNLGWAYFVHFSGDFRRTLLNEVTRGIPNFSQVGKSEDQIAAEAMAVLMACGKEDLLIVDNADKCSFSQLRWELSGLPMKVLVTTRTAVPGAVPIVPLNREALYAIFEQHMPGMARRDMDALIQAVDGHTLTVDLMARTMGRGRRSATPEKLLTALGARDLTGGFTRVETAYPGSPDQARINEHLKAVFQVAALKEGEQELLRSATLLPKEGMDDALFLTPFDEEMGDTLDDLIEGGWLYKKDALLRIHPVIRIVCIEELKPSKENCEKFLYGLRNQHTETHYDGTKYRQLAEVFTEASEILADDRNGFWAGEASYFWNTIGEFRQALELQLSAAEKREQSQPDSAALAVSYNNVGSTYGDLGDHNKALEFQLKALDIWERVLDQDHPDLAGSYNNVGFTYGALGDHNKALEFQLKALDIRKRVLDQDHPYLARSYNNVGLTYGNLGDHDMALEFLLKALDIQKRVLDQDHPYLAGSYNNVGFTYGALGDHNKALEFKLKALDIQKRVLPGNHPSLALSHNNVAWTYSELGDPVQAAAHMRRAAEIINASSLPEGHPDRVNFNRWADKLEAALAGE